MEKFTLKKKIKKNIIDKMHLIIKGKNIYLRNLILKDVSRKYLDWLSDNEINQYLETRHHKQSLSLIKKFINDCKKNNSLIMAICIKKNQKHIGNIKIGPINKFHKTADISYFIGDKEEWGKGYATEAVKLAVNYSFESLNLYKCLAGIYSSNIGSKKVLKKSGFKKEAVIKEIFQNKIKREDHIIFGITNRK